MPEQILHKYQYPIHPELILCLIENKKIHPNDLQKLGFNKID